MYQAQSGGVAEEGDDDNREVEDRHGGISPVVHIDGVVQGGISEMGLSEIKLTSLFAISLWTNALCVYPVLEICLC